MSVIAHIKARHLCTSADTLRLVGVERTSEKEVKGEDGEMCKSTRTRQPVVGKENIVYGTQNTHLISLPVKTSSSL